jgi:hypothetical protein
MNQANIPVNFIHKGIFVRQLSMLSCLTLVAGATIFLIALYGSPTPIYDQWDLEAGGLYKPYLEGQLGFVDLFAPYNEHRLFFTRVFALALFELRGAWDPIWEMVIDIAFRLLAIWLLLVLLTRLITASGALTVALFCAAVYATPFTWETILMAYPSTFYLLLIFSFGAFLLFNGNPAWSVRWSFGTLLGVLSYFNVASGALTLVAVDSMICMQILFGMRRGVREWTGLGLHLALVILMFLGVPTLETNAPLRAHSIAQFAEAFSSIAAWPLAAPYGLFLYAPSLIFVGMIVISRPAATDGRWYYVVLLAWLILQLASLAYGRAARPLESRYIDFLAAGVVLNFAIIVYLCGHVPAQGTLFSYALAACWIVTVSFAGAGYASREIPYALNYHSSWLQTKTKNIRQFLETNDGSLLAGKGLPDIPYSNPIRLMQLLSDPAIRNILPSNLVGDDKEGQFVQPRTYLRGGGSKIALEIRDWMLHSGYVFVAVGFASLMLALMRCEWDRRTGRRSL